MCCGRPHETECSEVLAAVWLYLDQECDCERRTKLQRHLEECNPCLERYGLEEQLKTLLARKCGGEQAPNELRQRLCESILALMTQTTLEVDETASCTESSATVEITVTRRERSARRRGARPWTGERRT